MYRETALKRFWLPERRVWAAICTAVLALSLVGSIVQAYDFVGGSSSVKVVERTGADGEPLTIGRSGVADSSLSIGMGPVISTLQPTDLQMGGGTTATLRGRVTGMNGFPSASVYFEWGYSAGGLSTSTPAQTASGTGAFTATITGYDPNRDVYYRFVGEADGMVYGGVQSFRAQGSVAISYRLTVLTVVVWLAIVIFAIWSLTALGAPLVWAVVIGGIIAYIGPIGARIILQALLQWW